MLSAAEAGYPVAIGTCEVSPGAVRVSSCCFSDGTTANANALRRSGAGVSLGSSVAWTGPAARSSSLRPDCGDPIRHSSPGSVPSTLKDLAQTILLNEYSRLVAAGYRPGMEVTTCMSHSSTEPGPLRRRRTRPEAARDAPRQERFVSSRAPRAMEMV